jgi:membrane-associated phospholipid phosphatase
LPSLWNESDFSRLGVDLAADLGGAMGDLDTQALRAMYGGAHGAWGPAMIAFTLLGGGWAVLAFLPLLAWSRTRRFAGVLAVAIAAQATWVWALKLVVGRVRPWIAMGLAAPLGAPHDGSFPSGHASGSFCVAVFVAVALPAVWPSPAWRVRFVAVAALAIATLVAVSRVYLGAHFPSDALAGALMGACFGAAAGGHYVSRRSGDRGTAVR